MGKPQLFRHLVVTLFVACLAAGCATPPKSKAAALNKQQRELSEGYSLLYTDAGKFDTAELILYVKAESAAMKEIVTAVADAGAQLKKELEGIARTHPYVRIDLNPLPGIEIRKRAAIAKDRAKKFAPVVGVGGREYERTVLIGYSNGLNHERYLCRVLAAEEPDPELKKILLEAGKRYDALYERVMALLEKEYFRT